jgi:hypothetical protein
VAVENKLNRSAGEQAGFRAVLDEDRGKTGGGSGGRPDTHCV